GTDGDKDREDGGGSGSDANQATDGAPGTDTGGGNDAGADADAGFKCTATPCVVQIAAGGAHTCARLVDGSVRCWGANAYGECGGGTIIPSDGGVDETVNPSMYATPNIVTGIPAPATVIGGGGSYRTYGNSCAATSDLK